MPFLYLKAVHIVFVVSWFAGLFYVVRLFIYHVEARELDQPARSILERQYALMESRLWNIITVPSMVITVGTGIAMIALNPGHLQAGWMHLKLGFVVLLLVYHFMCGAMIARLKRGEIPMSALRLRMWNEVATLLLVAIVFLVVVRSALSWAWGAGGLLALGILFMVIIKAVNKHWKR